MELLLIDGRYRLERELRYGGNGVIYYGTDTRLGRPVAVKRVLPHMGLDAGNAALLDEARVIARLQHPGITQVYDIREADDGGIFIIMEYVDGRDLRSIMKERGALEPAVAVHIAACVCEALQYAHTAVDPADGTPLCIVHRDITPANIMLTRTGAVKLIDFGIARHKAREQDLTMTGTLKGTIAYMSPEQVRGERNLDARTDLFSLGAVLFEMLAGQKLFGGTGMSDYQQMQQVETVDVDLDGQCRTCGIPVALQPVLDACLARDRDERYADADAMRAALQTACSPDEYRSVTGRLRSLASAGSPGGDADGPAGTAADATAVLERTAAVAAPDAPTVTLQRDDAQAPPPATGKPERNTKLLALLSVVTVAVAGGGAMLWPAGDQDVSAGAASQPPVVAAAVAAVDTVPLFKVTVHTVPDDAVLYSPDGSTPVDRTVLRLPARDTVFLVMKRGYRDVRYRLTADAVKRGTAGPVTLQALTKQPPVRTRKNVVRKKVPPPVRHMLSVTVKNGSFAPLTGAVVSCTGPDGATTVKQTGSDGRTSIELAEGGQAVAVSCAGYRSYKKTITVGDGIKPLTVMLYEK